MPGFQTNIIMKNLNLFLIGVIVIFGISCRKENKAPDVNITPEVEITKHSISGVIQKGPFISGSSISVYEMDASLIQTGKSYTAQITNNNGTFQLSNVALTYPYVNLRADGFYFNEITGLQSNSQITLYAFSDLTNKSSINVNILSHIEKQRIEYLVSQGLTFSLAKKQAEREILQIFSIYKSDLPESETLDISKNGDNNAILLAISLIVQGYRSESEMTELLSNISLDIKTDGVLNSSSIGTDLINHAKIFNLKAIRQNIQTRWNTLGIVDTISNFEYYIHKFIDNTSFTFNNNIEYPYSSDFGLNMLNDSVNQILIYNPGTHNSPINSYSFTAKLKKGHALKVVFSKENPCKIYGGYGLTYYFLDEIAPYTTQNFSYSYYGQLNGIPPVSHTQTFTSLESNKTCNVRLRFVPTSQPTCSFKIEIYENNSVTPTKIKHIQTKWAD